MVGKNDDSVSVYKSRVKPGYYLLHTRDTKTYDRAVITDRYYDTLSDVVDYLNSLPYVPRVCLPSEVVIEYLRWNYVSDIDRSC